MGILIMSRRELGLEDQMDLYGMTYTYKKVGTIIEYQPIIQIVFYTIVCKAKLK